MARKVRKRQAPKISRRTKPGAPPGIVIADPEQPQPVIHVISFGPEGTVESSVPTPAEARRLVGQRPMTWINVEGLGDAQVIEQFGDLFGLHRLALEDTVNLHQRAKVESYGDVLFVVLRFDRVRARLREGSGKFRQLGSDYLAYSLIDAVIDNFYPVLEVYAERLDELEELVMQPHHKQVMDFLHDVKQDLLVLRRAVWPLRDAMAFLAREDNARISDNTRLYLRDCYDHVVQVVDLIETYRELTADLRDLYMSSLSNRINETMRVLTIISTLFIPLTFIVGIYGMNFDWEGGTKPLNMPELHWYYGYPACLAAMATTAIAMLVFFYRRGWILRH
jgi:magnesium transporter